MWDKGLCVFDGILNAVEVACSTVLVLHCMARRPLFLENLEMSSLDLAKGVTDQLEGQSNKCVCTRKSRWRKMHVKYYLAMKHRWLGHVQCLEMKFYYETLLKGE